MLSFGHICFWSHLFLKRSLFQVFGQLCRTPRTGSCFKRFSSHRRFGTWNHWYEEPKPSHVFWHLITIKYPMKKSKVVAQGLTASRVTSKNHPTWLRDREPREPREPHYLKHCNRLCSAAPGEESRTWRGSSTFVTWSGCWFRRDSMGRRLVKPSSWKRMDEPNAQSVSEPVIVEVEVCRRCHLQW